MKKNKKIIIIIVSAVLLIVAGIFIFYNFIYDKNQLSISEKEWINKNKSNIISVNIPRDLNIFSESGEGIFHDFIDDFSEEHNIKINKNNVDLNNNNGLGFVINNNYNDKDLLIFKDHYVIISKENTTIKRLNELAGKKIGGLSESIAKITSTLKTGVTFTIYETEEALNNAIANDEISLVVVPLNEYIDEILKNNYHIIYHLDNIVKNYFIRLGEDKTLNSIINKFYNKWMKTSYEDSYYENTNEMFIKNLGITNLEVDNLTNKVYNYGFVNEAPFNLLNSSKYGGIIISYLEEFSEFSDVEISYTKYKNYNDLKKAFNNKKVDLLFNNSSLNINNTNIDTNIKHKFYLISPHYVNLHLENLTEANNITVYVVKDSALSKYLENYKNITLKYVKNEKSLFKKSKSNIIALESETYDYYKNIKINNTYVSYEGYLSNNYGFKYLNANDTFTKLFSAYINYLSQNEMTNKGFITYKQADKQGTIISSIAKYFLLIVVIITVVILGIIRSKKKVKLNTKIKKDEKLKFIDVLTSLKNRNYLNERIKIWNQNTIYPQAVIIIDLNNIKYLNDTFGHVEGDKQIMAAANILHQTQLDNTEIIRTDGNEFMVYMVGYQEKQVLNYIKKLVKEFNKLPYEYGAAIGFSMIVDDLKLIDDAINEATIQMRENKEHEASTDEKENN